MAGFKRKKEVKQKEVPKGKIIAQGGDPERYYSENPAWTFANSDQEMWAFTQDHIGDVIWTEILPRLKEILLKTYIKNIRFERWHPFSILLNGFFWCARWAHVLTGERRV